MNYYFCRDYSWETEASRVVVKAESAKEAALKHCQNELNRGISFQNTEGLRFNETINARFTEQPQRWHVPINVAITLGEISQTEDPPFNPIVEDMAMVGNPCTTCEGEGINNCGYPEILGGVYCFKVNRRIKCLSKEDDDINKKIDVVPEKEMIDRS